MDGRGLTDIRPLDAEVQVIPRVHGSAIFQRGETQILGVTTLNMLKMEQQIDSLSPVTKKRYLHHYNFPPYSTGETGRVGFAEASRDRARLPRRARARAGAADAARSSPTRSVRCPRRSSSNGSTSMGSVCASTLSLLNAGVPLQGPRRRHRDGPRLRRRSTARPATRPSPTSSARRTRSATWTSRSPARSEFVTAIQLDTKLDGIPSSVLDGRAEAGQGGSPRRSSAC